MELHKLEPHIRAEAAKETCELITADNVDAIIADCRAADAAAAHHFKRTHADACAAPKTLFVGELTPVLFLGNDSVWMQLGRGAASCRTGIALSLPLFCRAMHPVIAQHAARPVAPLRTIDDVAQRVGAAVEHHSRIDRFFALGNGRHWVQMGGSVVAALGASHLVKRSPGGSELGAMVLGFVVGIGAGIAFAAFDTKCAIKHVRQCASTMPRGELLQAHAYCELLASPKINAHRPRDTWLKSRYHRYLNAEFASAYYDALQPRATPSVCA